MFWSPDRLPHPGRIDIGLLKQPHHELDPQDAAHRPVNHGFGHPSLIQQLLQLGVTPGEGSLHIHPRLQCLEGGLLCRRGGMVKMVQHHDAGIVGKDNSFKLPLLPQYLVQQPPVCMSRHPVHLVVGGHHRVDACIPDRHPEPWQVGVSHLPLSDGGGGQVDSGHRCAVAGKMFGSTGQFACRQSVPGNGRIPLHADNKGAPHHTSEVGVFTVTLLYPAETGIPDQVEQRGERHVCTACRGLPGNRLGHLADQVGVPGTTLGNRLWEDGGTQRQLAMKALRHLNGGNAQAGLLAVVAVGQTSGPGHLIHIQEGALQKTYSVRPKNLVERFGKRFSLFIILEVSQRMHVHLRNLLLQRHPGKQVRHPLLHRRTRILVTLRLQWQAKEEE